MNLPNKITMLRILLAFLFMLFLFSKGAIFKTLALITFIFASVSDFMDGYIARKNNTITDFGRLMDPIADKILVLAAFLAFVEMKLIPAWTVVLIILRELIITGVRILASTKGKIIPASSGGKHKTVSQMIAIITILIFLVLREVSPSILKWWSPGIEDIIFGLMFLTVVLTLTSGVAYLVENKDVFLNAERN